MAFVTSSPTEACSFSPGCSPSHTFVQILYSLWSRKDRVTTLCRFMFDPHILSPTSFTPSLCLHGSSVSAPRFGRIKRNNLFYHLCRLCNFSNPSQHRCPKNVFLFFLLKILYVLLFRCRSFIPGRDETSWPPRRWPLVHGTPRTRPVRLLRATWLSQAQTTWSGQCKVQQNLVFVEPGTHALILQNPLVRNPD